MNWQTTEAYIRACALMAELESYKVANKERERQGYALAYDEKAFDTVRVQLEQIANNLRLLNS